MITRVRLKNIRSHLNTELAFTGGTNALLGHLGSGKSSILEAICFGLFGTTPLLQSKKLKLNDLIMNKPIVQNKAEIEVSFKIGDKTYSVKRVIERDKGTTYAELRENGNLLEAPSAQRVTELVEKILKVGYELFSKVVYSEQNALDYFLTIPRGQRMKKMDELLMIDKFEAARANCTSLVNTIINIKAGKQSAIGSIDVDNLKQSIEEVKVALKADTTEAASIKNELERLANDRTKLEKHVSELKLAKEQLETLKKEERALSATIEELRRGLASLEEGLKGIDAAMLEKKYKEVNSFIKDAEDVLKDKEMRYQKLRVQTSKDEAELNVLKRDLAKMEKDLDEKMRIKQELEAYKKSISADIEKDLENKKKLVEEVLSGIEADKVRIKDLEDAVQQMASLGARCPVCDAKLTPTKKKTLIKQKKLKISALKEHLEELSKRRKALEADIKQLEDAKKKWDEMEKDLEDLESLQKECENYKHMHAVLSENLSKSEKELEKLEKEAKDLQKKYKTAVEDKQNLEKILYRWNDYMSKKKRVSELLADREKITAEIVEVSEKLRGIDLEKEEKALTAMMIKEKEMATRLQGLRNLIKEKEIRLKDFETRLERIEKEKKEIEKLERLAVNLKIFGRALEEVQTELRREFVVLVNYTMNNIWPTLYPYRDFEGIRLNVEEGDYVLQLRSRGGEWVNVEGVVSGGERSLACLALRIAFSLALAPQLKVLVLDEPTHNLDEKSVETLAATFRERIMEFVDQLFIISHDPKIEEAVTGRAYRLERDKAREGPTKVIAL